MSTPPIDSIALADHLPEQARISRLLSPASEGIVRGPWKILDATNDDSVCVGADADIQICVIPTHPRTEVYEELMGTGDNKQEMLAHAHLIAAAPEILDALIKLVSLAGLPHHPTTSQALAAIAKARGIA